jgi:hypothetical protein
MARIGEFIAVAVCCFLASTRANAETTTFFSSCQASMLLASGVTSDTISSNGYLFTYTRDKLFTGGTGTPIGRPVLVTWPNGVEAQAVTTPPPGVTDYKARITLQRVDGGVFALTAFTFKLLANTAGAGGTLEIMPSLNGEDGFADPLYFDATGYSGSLFSYNTSPNPWGSTALLTGFDTYRIGLYVDYALVALTLDSPSPDLRGCCLPDHSCANLTAAACLVQGGAPQAAGTSCSCNACPVLAGPPPVPDGSGGSTPLLAEDPTSAGDSMQVTWDAISCPANGYNLVHGDLGNIAGYSLNGSACSIGSGGNFLWNGLPAGDFFFLIVGIDGAGTESSWGRDGANQERNGTAPSGACGATSKNPTATCP